MTLKIELADETRTFIEYQVKQGAFPSAEAYVHSLINAAQRRSESLARLERDLMSALNSGPPVEITPAYWTERRRQLEQAIQRRSAGQ